MQRWLATFLALFLTVLPVDAQTPNLNILRMNGGITAAYSWNFAQKGSLDTNNFTYAGASLKTVVDATGNLTYAPNNLLTYSNTFSNAAWSLGSSGTGTNPTLTAGYTTDPNGNPATRVQMSLGATPSTAYTRIVQSVSGGSFGRIVNSVWIKTNDATTQTIYMIGTGAGATYGVVTVTGSWTLISPGYYTTTGPNFQLGLAGAGSSIGVTTSTSVDISIAEATLSAVTYETSPRSGDQVITTSAAYYGPAFDCATTGGPYAGLWTGCALRVEGSATNLLTYSGAVGGTNYTLLSNGSSNPVVTQNYGTAPDGTNNATRVQFPAISSNSNRSIIYQSATVVSGSTYTRSVYARATTGTASLQFANGTYSVLVALTTSWQRISVPVLTSSTTDNWEVGPDPLAGGPVTSPYAAADVMLWGAQTELGSFATSYEPTAASTVARAGDVVGIIGPALAVLKGSAGAAVLEWNPQGFTSGTRTALISGSTYPQIFLHAYAASINSYQGTNVDLNVSNPVGVTSRSGISWNAAGRTISGNGVAPASGSGTFSGITAAYLGQGAGDAQLNGHATKLYLYNKALPPAVLQSNTNLNTVLH